MFRTTTLFSLSILFSVCLQAQARPHHKKVLFLGNETTGSNGMHTMLQAIALSAGDTLEYTAIDSMGFSLANHHEHFWSKLMISKAEWDYVVLQEKTESLEESTGTWGPGLAGVDDLVRSSNKRTIIHVFMNWAYKNGDSVNCSKTPATCTYPLMDKLMQDQAMLIANSNETELSPVAAVWSYMRTNYPSIELYKPGGMLPSEAGSYLSACCLYASIFRSDPTKIKNDLVVDPLTASVMRIATRDVVYNQMKKWSIGRCLVKAIIDTQYTEPPGSRMYYSKLRFMSLSTGDVDSLSWSFGNGIYRNTQVAEFYYPFAGTYYVTLTVAGCNIDSAKVEVRVFYDGIDNVLLPRKEVQLTPVPSGSTITLSCNQCNFANSTIQIYDYAGKQVFNKVIEETGSLYHIHTGLPTGNYFTGLFDEQGNLVFKRKLIIDE